MTTAFFFYLFAAVLVFAALRVVTARNPVHAVLYLVLAFFNAAGIWLLLEAEFLAIALVVVYVGAVMVLFLFVVMMLDIRIDRLREGLWRHGPVAGLIGAVIVVEMGFVLLHAQIRDPHPMALDVAALGQTRVLGMTIYTHYLYPLELAAVLLLVAIIAAIALTLRSRKDTRRQDPAEQVKVRKADRLRILRMDPVLPAAPVEAAPAVPAAAAPTPQSQPQPKGGAA